MGPHVAEEVVEVVKRVPHCAPTNHVVSWDLGAEVEKVFGSGSISLNRNTRRRCLLAAFGSALPP